MIDATDAAPLFAALDALASVSREEKLRLLPLLKKRTLAPGEAFVRAGRPTDTVGFLVGGVLRYFYVDDEGREFTRYFCQGNSFVSSQSALVTGDPSAYSIEALEESRLLVFTYADWLALVNRDAVWSRIQRQVLDQALVRAESRERSLILDDAMTRYQTFLRDYPGLEPKVRQYDIASYLGISPVTLSRLRGKPAPKLT